MNKLALFLAGLLLGMFVSRFVALSYARIPYPPPTAVTAPDNDEGWAPCEYTTKLLPLYP